jgi:hypothetical protein
LLFLVRAVKFLKPAQYRDQLEKLITASQRAEKLPLPIRVVAGGCNKEVEQEMQQHRPLLIQAFAHFKGTVLSGGTTNGISGLMASVAAENPAGDIKLIGYLPAAIPFDPDIRVDDRHYTHRKTSGDHFGPLQPLKNWLDILHSVLDAGIDLSWIKLFGINGGKIAAFEYRLALLLGAEVAVLEGSGRAADDLFRDPDWKLPNLQDLARLSAPQLQDFTADRRELLARCIHTAFLAHEETLLRKARLKEKPSLADWEDLSEELKESNRARAADILRQLGLVSITAHPVHDGSPIHVLKFTPEQIGIMARAEHNRWMEAKQKEGWHLGNEYNEERKTHPSLLPWEQLSEQDKEKTREMVRVIPKLLEVGRVELRPASGPLGPAQKPP